MVVPSGSILYMPAVIPYRAIGGDKTAGSITDWNWIGLLTLPASEYRIDRQNKNTAGPVMEGRVFTGKVIQQEE